MLSLNLFFNRFNGDFNLIQIEKFSEGLFLHVFENKKKKLKVNTITIICRFTPGHICFC